MIRALGVTVLALLMTGCLMVTERLPGPSSVDPRDPLVGHWEILPESKTREVPAHHSRISVLPEPALDRYRVVMDADRFVAAEEAAGACAEREVSCLRGYPAEGVLAGGVRLLSLESPEDEEPRSFAVLAYAIDGAGTLTVYQIEDRAIRSAVQSGRLRAQADDGELIASSPVEVAAWLSTLAEKDLKRYARYARR